jgi:transcriptional regulator with XRE-family HTH domain
MKKISECLGENIKRLRKERKLTQIEFAQRANLSISFLQNIESGKRWVSPKTVTVLARALKVSESELFWDFDHKPSAIDSQAVLTLLSKTLDASSLIKKMN